MNELLSLPFILKVATKDWHPQDHISFASNHPPPNNVPFETEIVITNPLNPAETQTTRLWPDHCVQGSQGAQLVPELDMSGIDHVVEKGQDSRVEMYSAFADPFLQPTVSRSKLAEILKEAEITHVYIVGLAMDYCVRFTAIDAAKEGITTYVIEEGTKAVNPTSWAAVKAEMEKAGVQIVTMGSDAVSKTKGLNT